MYGLKLLQQVVNPETLEQGQEKNIPIIEQEERKDDNGSLK